MKKQELPEYLNVSKHKNKNMAGIAGIFKGGETAMVENMLGTIKQRGNFGKKIFERPEYTVGIIWNKQEDDDINYYFNHDILHDGPGFGQMANVRISNGSPVISRDTLGVSPMYYTMSPNGRPYAFASEVKSLLPVSGIIYELAPGHLLTEHHLEKVAEVEKKPALHSSQEEIKRNILDILFRAVSRRIKVDSMGVWLSGGLDSSIMTTLARPFLKTIHTFSAGTMGAPDLEYAREVASFTKAEHHEILAEKNDLLTILPEVIFNLESFDALLVRSSVINYLVSREASYYVSEVFSGEGGDELFGGYLYLKSLPVEKLENELLDISKRLHNTAFQRVDRSASAFGIVPHIVFADPDVFNYALSIPVQYKIKDGTEKWILREAMEGLLPERVLRRTKAKFWEGAGVGEMLSDHASRVITDGDFMMERRLRNGWVLNTKEECLYYRIFREWFGDLENLDWMGRSKGAPVSKS